MATANNHLLQKVTFEIGLAKQEGAFEIQNRISNVFQSLILRELERLFDAKGGGDRVISIDKLEIDLGNISVLSLEADVEKAFLQQIENFMAALSAEVDNAVAADERTVREMQVRWSGNAKSTAETRIQLSNTAASHFEKLTQLLLFGVCAAAGGKTGVGTLTELMHPVLEQQSPALVRFVLQNKNTPQLLHRLALNLTAPQLTYLLSLLGCRNAAALADNIRSAAELLVQLGLKLNRINLPSHLHFPEASRFLWWLLLVKFTGAGIAAAAKVRTESVLPVAGTERVPLDAVTFRDDSIEDILTELVFVAARLSERPILETSGQLKKSMRGYQFTTAVNRALKQVTESLQKAERRSTKRAGSKTISPATPREQALLNDNSALLKNSLFTLPEKTEQRSVANVAEEIPGADTGLYINNAGLVLLTPFLKTFFTNLGLVEDKEFVSQEAKWKAAHLLQTACGFLPKDDGTAFGEGDMVLNKLLCGIGIHETIPDTFTLSESDHEEIESLLKSILHHWTIMSRSSVYALQVTFLQKQGRLSVTGKNWDLLIERDSAVEILIDKLPWTIGFIKLPWTDYIITTTW
jgi:hypothetical protein